MKDDRTVGDDEERYFGMFESHSEAPFSMGLAYLGNFPVRTVRTSADERCGESPGLGTWLLITSHHPSPAIYLHRLSDHVVQDLGLFLLASLL